MYLEPRQYTQCSVIYTLYLYYAARMVLYLILPYSYYRTFTTLRGWWCTSYLGGMDWYRRGGI